MHQNCDQDIEIIESLSFVCLKSSNYERVLEIVKQNHPQIRFKK